MAFVCFEVLKKCCTHIKEGPENDMGYKWGIQGFQ